MSFNFVINPPYNNILYIKSYFINMPTSIFVRITNI